MHLGQNRMQGGAHRCLGQVAAETHGDPKMLAVGLAFRGWMFGKCLRKRELRHRSHGREFTAKRSTKYRVEITSICKIIAPTLPKGRYSSIVDEIDREIVQLLQDDATLSARELADAVGLTATPCWRRVQNLERDGVIEKRVALVNPAALNLDMTALVQIRTNDHSAGWLKSFQRALDNFPEVVEAYRTSGETDYVLKAVVPSIEAYDRLYKRLIEEVDLYDVRTVFVMEKIKETTALPLTYLE